MTSAGRSMVEDRAAVKNNHHAEQLRNHLQPGFIRVQFHGGRQTGLRRDDAGFWTNVAGQRADAII